MDPTADKGGGISTDALRLRESTRDKNWAALGVAGFIVWVLEPIYWVFDFFLVPDHATGALVMRSVLFVLGVIVHMLARRKGGVLRKHDYAVSCILGVAVGWSMNLLVYWEGWPEADYFVGIMFVMIAVGFLFSWPLKLTLAFYGVILAPFFVPLFWAADRITMVAISHILYLCTTALVTGFSQHFRAQLESREFYANLHLERTKESLEDALVQLKQLDKLKSQFFNTITHELRTPLTMIMAPVDVMRSEQATVSNSSRRKYLDAVWKNGLKLLNLINSLLDLAKLAERFLRLQLTETSLRPLLEEILEHALPLAARKEIELRLTITQDPQGLYVDLDKMERVVVNLLSNALKFTPAGGTVEVLLGVDNGQAVLAFRDTGIGIAQDKREAIFERFTQGDADVTRQFGGTGIGLALVKEIIELHRGSIEVDSVQNEGSTFTVRLTLGQEHFEAGTVDRRSRRTAPSIDLRRAEDAVPTEWSRNLTQRSDYRFFELEEATERRVISERDDAGKDTKVLIVEDNVDIIRFISVLLSAEHSVYTAGDGKQGLELALRERPDLIVTDYMMPEMDGLRLIEALRADPITVDTPIIMLTAKTEVEDRAAARGCGADVYIAKPFSPQELQLAVRRELEKQGRKVDDIIQAQANSLEHISAGLAHELHNPLSYIRNASFVVGETLSTLRGAVGSGGEDLEALGKKVDMAMVRLDRMHAIMDKGVVRIQQIVELIQRYARDGYPDTPSELELDQVVRDVIALVQPRDGADVTLDMALGCEGATVKAIPEELNQVVGNLVQNAYDAVGENGIVRVETRRDGDNAIFQVTDDGPGIPREDQKRIFAPFFSTKTGQGKGIGLTIVQRVVRQACGRVEVISKEGAGATIRVSLPAS